MARRRRRSKYGTFIRIKFDAKSKIALAKINKESYSDTINRVFGQRTRWL